jgi:hypothetical protein
MKLWQKQARFTDCVIQLIRTLTEQYNYRVTLGECYRPPETAELYSKQGIGSANSNHCVRLAVDLNLFYQGEFLTSLEEYRTAGGLWKSLDPDARWGGDFKNLKDGNHFSFEHLGHQ